jgi:hypothetical protein
VNRDEMTQVAEVLVSAIMQADSRWLPNIRQRLAEGENYEVWRASFQTDMIDRFPPLRAVLAKPDAEQLLRAMWEVSRAKAAEGSA